MLKRIRKILIRVFLIFLGLSLCSVLLFKFVPVPFTPLMITRSMGQKFDGKELICKKSWVSKDKISNKLQLAVVCSEDQNFLTHHGFDLKAIEKAMKHNEKSKKVRGASTISQQTAKNVFLWQGRSWIRKAFEVYFTFLIETFWSKERILEVYLNVIEMGDGIYGAEAASQEYFDKPAAKLSAGQAALIAAVLPNPIKYSAKRPGPYIQRRQQWILRQMNHWGGVLKY